jgi:hypothetical protein
MLSIRRIDLSQVSPVLTGIGEMRKNWQFRGIARVLKPGNLTSGIGYKQTYSSPKSTSASPPKADVTDDNH